MADIFISYSRRDSVFAKQLTNALEKSGRDVWIDWQDIPRAADWLNEIYSGIERAESVVQVVSIHSLISEVCNQEIAYARKQGKRIIPLIHENITPEVEATVKAQWNGATWEQVAQDNWDAIRHLNWIFFPKTETGDVDEDVFEREYAALIQALDTDLTHVRFHTRYLVQTLDWEENARNPSYLLFGDELTSGEKWLAGWDFDRQCRIDAGDTHFKQPIPTDLQRTFIKESRIAENERAARLMQLEISRKMSEQAAKQSEASAQRAQRDAQNARRVLVALGAVGVLIIVGVFFFTTFQITQARDSENSAATSAAEARTQVSGAQQRVLTAEVRERDAVSAVAAANATLAPIPATLTRSSLILDEALTNVADARTVLGAIPPTLTYVSNEIEAGERRIESLRFASYAQQYLNGSEPNAELAALFAIRSLIDSYTETADAVLVPASERLHTMRVFDVAESDLSAAVISDDGRDVITGGFDGSLRAWDANTGELRYTLEQQSAGINAMALSPNGAFLVVALSDQSLSVLDAQTGRLLVTMPNTFNYISEVDVSPDGLTVLSGARNGTLYLWDISTGRLIRRFTGHASEIFSIAFSADGQRFVSSANEPVTRLWNVETGELIRTFTEPTANVNIVSINPDGSRILSGSVIDGFVRVWDAETGEVIREFGGEVSVSAPIVFSDDGRTVLIGTGGSGIRWWDVEKGQLLRIFEGHSGRLLDAAFSPLEQTALSVSLDGTLRAWDLDLSNRTRQALFGHEGPVISTAFSPNGQWAISGGSDSIRLWDVQTGETIRLFEGHQAPVFKVVFSADGQSVLSASFDGSARLWDVRTGETLRIFNTLEPLFTAAFVPNGRSIITGSQIGTVREYDIETGALIRDLVPHADSVWSLHFTPDGRRLLSSANDGEILVTDFEMGDILNIFPNNTTIFDLAIHPNGQMFAVAAPDYSIHLRELDFGATQRVLRGHTNVIYALAFSADGRTLVSASADNTLRLWNAETGELIRVLSGHRGVVRSAAFNPRNQLVISASFDGTLRLWDVDYRMFIAGVCAELVRDFTPEERDRFSIDQTPTCAR